MPLALSNKPTFFFRVKVNRPNEESGRWEVLEFVAEFKRRDQAWLQERLKNGLPDDDEIVSKEFVGWKEVKGADGNPLKCSEETRKWMLEHMDDPLAVSDEVRTGFLLERHIRPAIAKAWVEASYTGPAKN